MNFLINAAAKLQSPQLISKLSLNNFIFQVFEYIFQILEYSFQTLEYIFKDFERRIRLGKWKNYPKQKEKVSIDKQKIN